MMSATDKNMEKDMPIRPEGKPDIDRMARRVQFVQV